MTLVTFGGPFSQGAVAILAERMGNTVIVEAGLDAFKCRILDAVAQNTFILLKALQVFCMAEDHLALGVGKDQQILCRVHLSGEDVARVGLGASGETCGQEDCSSY
jgi:hypothetical protein